MRPVGQSREGVLLRSSRAPVSLLGLRGAVDAIVSEGVDEMLAGVARVTAICCRRDQQTRFSSIVSFYERIPWKWMRLR
jgi:hypothetical protein